MWFSHNQETLRAQPSSFSEYLAKVATTPQDAHIMSILERC